MWAEHEERWPSATAAVDRSRDPAGSWRGDGNQYLNPEQNALVNDMISRTKQAAPSITENMREIERENTCSAKLDGLDHLLKGESSFKEKAAGNREFAPDAASEQVLSNVPDAIRYTFCAAPENYKNAYYDIKQRLEARDCTMVHSQNYWSNPEYKGINTRWITKEGQQFEVQFHTEESFDAKHRITHSSYERLRNPLTQDGEKRALSAFQKEVCSWISEPEGGHPDLPQERQLDARQDHLLRGHRRRPDG
jgi:hypothetical protein